MNHNIKNQVEKLKKFSQLKNQRHYKQIYGQMEELIDIIFDISDKVFVQQQDLDNSSIEPISL